ncbi:MAG TPA: hypothetical protein PL020_07115, partial [Candidatus Cloacimonadota bacterium]|nr:hypothetical protein [Candidatus Cloacimonadota bacterium]
MKLARTGRHFIARGASQTCIKWIILGFVNSLSFRMKALSGTSTIVYPGFSTISPHNLRMAWG